MSKLIVISSPSGGGKTTIVNAVMKKFPEMKFSISATTRTKRENETNGKEYFFLSREIFLDAVKNNELAEYEEIYGNYYGTLKSEILRALNTGSNMLFDVDVKGGVSIKNNFSENTITIFIAPPNIETLKKRLTIRGTENSETIEKRISRAEFEIEIGKKFDFIVVNDILENAINEVEIILNKIIN